MPILASLQTYAFSEGWVDGGGEEGAFVPRVSESGGNNTNYGVTLMYSHSLPKLFASRSHELTP